MIFIDNAESRPVASVRPLPAVTQHLMSDLLAYILQRPVSRSRFGIVGPILRFKPRSRGANPASAMAARMQRGPALVYLGCVTHCGGANRTNAPRTGLILSHCLGWLQQYENAFLAFPAHVASRLPRQIRDLPGHRIHRPNLGGYEVQDPAVLFETRSRAIAAVDSISEATAMELQTYYRSCA